jgi:hypothetical protein
MKKQLRLLGIIGILLLLIIPVKVSAQKFEISPYTGFMLGGKINYYQGYLKIEDGQNWGVAADITLAHETQLELGYSRLTTSVMQQSYTDYEKIIRTLIVDYIQIGSLREFDVNNDAFIPFFVGTLGMTVFTPRDGGYSSSTNFSITLGGGVKIFPTEHFGIRLQARLLMPMQFGGLGIGCGTGGCGGGVYSSTTFVQGDFTGGIIIRL